MQETRHPNLWTKIATGPLRWSHNGCDSVSNHQPYDCLLNRLFRRWSKKTSKPRLTGLCAGNSTGTGELSAQMASNAENVSIWWRHHDTVLCVRPHSIHGHLHPSDSDAGWNYTQHPTWPRALSDDFEPVVNNWWMGLWCFGVSRCWGKSINMGVAEPQPLKWTKARGEFSMRRIMAWCWVETISTQHILSISTQHPTKTTALIPHFAEHTTSLYLTYWSKVTILVVISD